MRISQIKNYTNQVNKISCCNYPKKSTQIYFYDKSIYYFKISDVSSELHSLSSFHLSNIIHKNSYFCQGGYRDKLQLNIIKI